MNNEQYTLRANIQPLETVQLSDPLPPLTHSNYVERPCPDDTYAWADPEHPQFPAQFATDTDPNTAWNSASLSGTINLKFQQGPESIDGIRIYAFASLSGYQWYTIYGYNAVTDQKELICQPTRRLVQGGKHIPVPPIDVISGSYKELEIQINSAGAQVAISQINLLKN